MLAKLFINYYIVFIIIIILAYYNIIYVIGHFFYSQAVKRSSQLTCMQAPLFATYAGDRVLLILLCK
jgi:hypothetical protein